MIHMNASHRFTTRHSRAKGVQGCLLKQEGGGCAFIAVPLPISEKFELFAKLGT